MKNPMVLLVGAGVIAVAAAAVLAGVAVERWDDPSAPAQSTTADTESAVGKAPEAERTKEQPESVEDLESAVAAAPIEDLAATPEAVSAAPAAAAVAENAAAAGKIEPAELPAERVADPEPVETPERVAAVDAAAPATRPVDVGASAAPEPEPSPEGPSFDVVRMEDDGSLLAVGRAAPGSEVALSLDGEVIATMPADGAGEWLIMPDEPLPPGSHELSVEASDATGTGLGPGQIVTLDVPERDGPGSPVEPGAEEVAAGHAADAEAAIIDAEPVAEAEEPVAESGADRVALAPLPQEEESAAPRAETPVDSREIPLTLETVDYNEDGEIVFSGRAQPGLTVSVYVDNRFVGEVTVGLDGNWEFTGGERIAPGRHTLRADLSDAYGKLSARVILPFVRADSRDVAALVESRRQAEPQPAPVQSSPAGAAPEDAENAPEPLVVVDEATADTEMAETAAPQAEPEPQADGESEAGAPEPEAEAIVDAEPVAPELDPEAVVDAEPVAPEPEAEVAETVVQQPAPEPEAAVVAEALAPQPGREPAAAAPIAPKPPSGPAAPVATAVAEDPVLAEGEPMPETGSSDGEGARVKANSDGPAADEPDVPASEPKAAPAGPGQVVIQPGNNLWRISRVIYGRGVKYTVIYQANRDRIRDPDLIYPGQIFATPGVRPPREIDPDWREPLSLDDFASQDTVE